MGNKSGRALTTARPSSLNPSVPHSIAKRLLWLPDHTRSMGIHLMAGKGSGKSRLLGRIIAWLDLIRGVPLVLIDPSGEAISNLIDKIVQLPAADQKRLWKRIIYVDMSGGGNNVIPFPLYYRLGNESLFTVSQRFLDVTKKLDPQLETASIQGWNALWRVGTYAGMILAALGFQISEAESLIRNPHAFSRHFDQLQRLHPELTPAVAFFQELAESREEARLHQCGSFLTKITHFGLDDHLKAMFGASSPGIVWQQVVDERLAVLFDFRGEWNLELRRFKMMWVFSYLLDWIKHRGPTRSQPISVIVDEITQILRFSSANASILSADFDELINVIARNCNIWLTLAHQELWQVDEKTQKTLMTMGTQIIGATSDVESALALAKQFTRYNPYWVKKREPMYMSAMGAPYVVDYHDVEFTPEEQSILRSYEFRDQRKFHFLVRPAISEGDVTGGLHHVSIERFDRGLYVNEELVAQARALLSRRCGIPVQTVLTEIQARLGRPQITPSPQFLSQGTIEDYEEDEGQDDLPEEEGSGEPLPVESLPSDRPGGVNDYDQA